MMISSTPHHPIKPDDILNFWFSELNPSDWWTKSSELDAIIASRFQDTLMCAKAGELSSWRIDAHGQLAEVILLDQFSRNIYRDTAQAFAQDAQALTLSQWAISINALEKLEPDQQAFLLLPFMHSESAVIHQEAVKLFDRPGLEKNYQFELKHKAIIDRFGRYPHRNALLGRTSTPEEIDFLKQPGSSF